MRKERAANARLMPAIELAEPGPSVAKRAHAPSPIGDEIADFHPQSSPLLFVMLSLALFYTEPLSYLRKINE